MRKKKFETVTYRDIFTGETLTRQEYVRQKHKKGAGGVCGKLLTKQMLIDAGIETVADDGSFIIINGKQVDCNKCGAGYRAFCINGIGNSVYAHRLMFAWHYGECKAGMVIDHKNGHRDQNNIENLQEKTNEENVRLRGDHSKTRLDLDENGEHVVGLDWWEESW